MRGVKQNGCIIKGCQLKHFGHGLCNFHYYRARRDGELTSSKKCKFENCQNSSMGLGFCKKHYTRFYRYGDPNIKHKPINNIHRQKFKPITIPVEELLFEDNLNETELNELGIYTK